MENGDLHKTIQELTIEVAVLKTRLDAKEHALAIQAREYERRLDETNHVLAREKEDKRTYLRTDTFDLKMSGLDDWRRLVDADRSESVGSKAMLTAIIAIVLSIATLAITLFLRWHT